ncbi:MAG: cobalt ECF transporter T component CbiQ [Anaerolineae bacterium]|nr:cobalt ECF transporter T component CbiQ [Chloroflexota bacterium]
MLTPLHEPYLPGEGPLHRLDPRLKVVATLALAMLASFVPATSWRALGALAMLLLALVWLSRLPLRMVALRLALAYPFVLLAAASVPFAARQGTPLWSATLGPVHLAITEAGLRALAVVLVRATLSLTAATLLVVTTPLAQLAHALGRLGVPAILADTISLTIRYLFVLADEAGRLMAARASRTAGQGLPLGARIRVLGGMIGSLLVRSLARAERVHAAMLARGHGSPLRRPVAMGWQPRDTVAALVSGTALLAVLAVAVC